MQQTRKQVPDPVILRRKNALIAFSANGKRRTDCLDCCLTILQSAIQKEPSLWFTRINCTGHFYHFQVHDILNENIFVVRKRQM